jgi:hypothetical protein
MNTREEPEEGEYLGNMLFRMYIPVPPDDPLLEMYRGIREEMDLKSDEALLLDRGAVAEITVDHKIIESKMNTAIMQAVINKLDSKFGRDLALRGSLTDKQVSAAAKMLIKYKRQIDAGRYQIVQEVARS